MNPVQHNEYFAQDASVSHSEACSSLAYQASSKTCPTSNPYQTLKIVRSGQKQARLWIGFLATTNQNPKSTVRAWSNWPSNQFADTTIVHIVILNKFILHRVNLHRATVGRSSLRQTNPMPCVHHLKFTDGKSWPVAPVEPDHIEPTTWHMPRVCTPECCSFTH
jgi:hypothetical protein